MGFPSLPGYNSDEDQEPSSWFQNLTGSLTWGDMFGGTERHRTHVVGPPGLPTGGWQSVSRTQDIARIVDRLRDREWDAPDLVPVWYSDFADVLIAKVSELGAADARKGVAARTRNAHITTSPVIIDAYEEGYRLRRDLGTVESKALYQAYLAGTGPLVEPHIDMVRRGYAERIALDGKGASTDMAQLPRGVRSALLASFMKGLVRNPPSVPVFAPGPPPGTVAAARAALPAVATLPLTEISRILTGTNVNLVFSPHQYVQWLLQDPLRVRIDVDAHLRTIEQQGYGTISAYSVYANCDPTSTDEVNIDSMPSHIDLSREIRDAMLPVSRYRESIIEYLAHIMKFHEEPATKLRVPMWHEYTVVYDAGKGRDPDAGGFPRLVFTSVLGAWSTPPYGVWFSSTLPVMSLITHVGTIPTQDYLTFYSRTMTPELARKLVYQLSIFPMEAVVIPISSHGEAIGVERDPHDTPLENIRERISNYPAVLRQLFGPTATTQEIFRSWERVKVPRTLSEGSRWRLYRYLGQHPEVLARLKPNHYPTLPFAMEDYIPDAVWATLPVEITRYAGPVCLVPNPYELLRHWALLAIAAQRDMALARGSEAKQLQQADEILPMWRDVVLSRAPHDLGSINVGDAVFYLAARGIREPPQQLSPHLFTTLVELADAGGIAQEAKNAVFIAPSFVERALNRLRDRQEYSIVARSFHIRAHRLLTTDQIRMLFLRGYVKPLPLGPTILSRYRAWQDMCDLRRHLMMTLYGWRTNGMEQWCKHTATNVEMERYIQLCTPGSVATLLAKLQLVPPPGSNQFNTMEYASNALMTMQPMIAHRRAAPLVAAAAAASGAAAPEPDTLIDLPDIVTPLGKAGGPPTLGGRPLHFYTDLEILRKVGARFTYATRAELIEQATALLGSGHLFFIPRERKCCNRLTYDLLETKDPEVFIIAYGCLADYGGYTLNELALALAPYGEDSSIYSYRIPKVLTSEGDMGGFIDITATDALNLRTLVTQVSPTLPPALQPVARDVVLAIDAIKAADRSLSEYDRERTRVYRAFPTPIQVQIRDYLMHLFHCGMYMRRWRGKTVGTDGKEVVHPFPLHTRDTERADFDPDKHVYPHLEALQKRIEALHKVAPEAAAFVHNLRQVDHGDGPTGRQSTRDSQNIKRITDMVINGHCIRLSSTIYIGCGAHYLHLFANVTIPGYQAARLTHIS